MNNPLSLYVSPMGIVEELFETPYEDEAIAFPSHAVNLGPNAWLWKVPIKFLFYKALSLSSDGLDRMGRWTQSRPTLNQFRPQEKITKKSKHFNSFYFPYFNSEKSKKF